MNTITLESQLTEFKAGFKTRAAPERIATMEAATQKLRDSGIEQTALKVADSAPRISLPNAIGNSIELATLWQQGPLIIIFYRGGWCPYCNLELRAWQQLLPQVKAAGATLVAVSPQTPDNSLSTAEKNELAFEVLSDSALEASNSFGLAFDMPTELVTLYQTVGHDLPKTNGNGRWVLPVPATYVINRQGLVQFAHVDVDYRNRAEPAEILAKLNSGN
jgi:peroxiredoxin